MKTTTAFVRGFFPLLLLIVLIGFASAQNITNTGTWTNTGTLTVTNFTNSGAAASFTNSGGGSVLELRSTLTTNASGALPANFDVMNGSVRYIGASDQSINHLVKENTYANLTGSSSGTSAKTLSGNVTVTGTLTSTGSTTTVTIADKILTLSGVIGSSTGSFTFSGGTVNYAGGAQNIFATTYGTLNISGTGNKTMAGDVTVSTALGLTAGNLQIGSNTLTANGTFPTPTGTIEGGASSNLVLAGTGSTTLPGITSGLGNFTLNRGGGDVVTLDGNLTVNSALTLTSGGLQVGSARTLTLNSTVSATSGTLSSASDGTVNYAQGSHGQAVLSASYGNLTFSNFNKTLGSSINIAGTFTPGSASGHTVAGNTITFNGGSQNIPSFTYNHLATAGGSVTKTATGNISTAGNFTNGANVTTNLASYTLAVTGTRSQSADSKMQFGGANGLLFSAGTVEYNGVTQDIAGHSSDKYANLLLSGSGTKTILAGAGNKVHTTSGLSILSGITLQVNGLLTVETDLTNAGTVNNAGTITVGN